MKVNIDQIEFEATQFRRENLIGQFDSVNCKRLLLSLNILTIYKPLSEDFSGMCMHKDDMRFMLINSSQQRGRQHFTIAHELYHLYIQKEFAPHVCNLSLIEQNDPKEMEANYFAASFLMPRESVYAQIPKEELESKTISLATILKMEQYFAVSHVAMLVRLVSLNLITKQQKESFTVMPISRIAYGYGYDMALYESANEGLILGDYGVLARNLFDSNRISESHYLDLMGFIGIDPFKTGNE